MKSTPRSLINEPSLTIDDLMEYIQGLDFPTAGFIHGRKESRRVSNCRGIVRMRAKVDIETNKDGKEAIIVTELPYQVNKAKLLESIADLVRDKRIEGILTSRTKGLKGMRIVIELKRDAYSQMS